MLKINKINKLNSLCRIIEKSQVYPISHSRGSVKNYDYFIYPFKGFSIIEPTYLNYVADFLTLFIKEQNPHLLLTIESDGIGVSTLVSNKTGIPLLISKKFHYRQPAIEFLQKSGYYNRKMYIPKQVTGHKVSFIDCIISTGGTSLAMVKPLEKENVEIAGMNFVINKPRYNGKERLRKNEINCCSLFDVFIKKSYLDCRPSEDIVKYLNNKNDK